MSKQLAFDNFPIPDVRPTLEMVPSVFTNQRDMLVGIQQLYGPIHADVTYSTGSFWRGLPKPPICTDLLSGDALADFTALPFASRSIPSMIIDPPFLVDRGREDSYSEKSIQMARRFTAYNDIGDLMSSYSKALYEAYRVIKSGGYLAFKCQDMVSRQKQVFTHCHVWQMALNVGFIAEDLFILVASGRITGHWKRQRSARKWHSYVWILKKLDHGRTSTGNYSSTELYTVNGKTQTLADWSRETGLNRNTIGYRLDHGWTIEEALTTPVNPNEADSDPVPF